MPADSAYPHYQKLISHAGRPYKEVLADVHRFLRPQSYLEIGVRAGATLRLATCKTIGVDPKFQIDGDVVGTKPSLHLVQLTSDDFFALPEIESHMGKGADFVFLDGLHHCEVVLRDFINVERRSQRTTVVAIHDCLPTDVQMARRDQFDQAIRQQTPSPNAWAGDVWKALSILERNRGDLTIIRVDSPPTGLALVCGLQPDSNVLRERYDDLVAEMSRLETDTQSLKDFLDRKPITSTNDLSTEDDLRRVLKRPPQS